MMLTEQTAVPGSALPVQAMKDHLRLGTGFADDGLQDGLIEAHLRAAIAAIEARTGKALLARRFSLVLSRWREIQGAQALPVAPVSAIVSVSMRDAAGVVVPLTPERYRLVPDMHRPRLAGVGSGLPTIAESGGAEIIFDAGFGSDWSAVPVDLAQAVVLLAAEFYERRHDGGHSGGAISLSVQSLIERWRTVRVLGGGGV